MSNFWLKMIGTAAEPWPEAQPYDRDHIGFRSSKPSGIRPGDKMVLYAVGGTKRIFAVVTATTRWKYSNERDWPWRVDISSPAEVNLAPVDGVDVDDVSKRLCVSLKRRSHLRLNKEEYERAAALLRQANEQ